MTCGRAWIFPRPFSRSMLTINGIHVVTDAYLAPGRGHIDVARAAVEAGAPVVQLRDKSISDREFFEIACAIRGVVAATQTAFIVNDRVDIALAAGADGVHIGQNDLPVDASRLLLGKDLVLGVSARSIEEVVMARAYGADYVGFGPIFDTATKADAGAATGLETLRKVKANISVPIVAIGGINETNIASVASAGADAVAVVSAVVCAPDMAKAVEELMRLFDSR